LQTIGVCKQRTVRLFSIDRMLIFKHYKRGSSEKENPLKSILLQGIFC
jgi:hypothetical protein